MSFEIVRAGPNDGFVVDFLISTAVKAILAQPSSWPDFDLELSLVTLIAKDASGQNAGLVMIADRLDEFDLESAIDTIQSVADGLISVRAAVS